MNFDWISNLKTCYGFIHGNSDILTLVKYISVPSAITALIIGLVVLFKSRIFISKTLFVISVLFSVWVLLDLITWISTNSVLTIFAWSLLGLVAGLIEISFFYFFYSFLFKKDLSPSGKFILVILLSPILFFTPTTHNIVNFDVVNCEATEGLYFTNYYYLLGYLVMVGILLFSLFNWKKIQRETVVVIIGAEMFLFLFTSLNSIATYLDNYYVGFYGLLGMNFFMILLTYAIIKFKAFNIKLIAIQALAWFLVIVIGSQFFFIQTKINMVLNSITFIVASLVGYLIVRSILMGVAQRETIDELAKNLEVSANKSVYANLSLQVVNEKLQNLNLLKSEFVSMATHQIRGPLSAIKGYISMIKNGEYGVMPKALDEPLGQVFRFADSLNVVVSDFLDASKIDLGQAKYELSEFDLRDLVKEIIAEFKPKIEAKGLEFRLHFTDSVCLIKADRLKLKQVIDNLVDNATKYTKSGWIEVSVEKKDNKVLLAVKDSGVGISTKTMSALFQRFSWASGAESYDVLGSGLGLYIAKKVVIAHHGHLWAESAGVGHGAQFYMEIPKI